MTEPTSSSAVHEGWREFLEFWIHEGRLQTFEDRERFRGAARALLAADTAPQAGGDETPVAWQWRKKGDPWSLEWTFNSEVFATTPDSEVRPLFTRPTPAVAAGVPLVTEERIAQLWYGGREFGHDIAPGYAVNFARAIEAEVVAVLSAGAPAVPLQDEQDSVHSIADDGQAPTAGLTSQTASGNTAASTEEDAPLSLVVVNALAQVYASSYASPHHITFTVEGLREFVKAVRPRTIQCDGRDGVTDSGASSEAREATPASHGPDGHGKDCA